MIGSLIFISNFQFAIFMQHFALALSWSFEFTLMVFPFYCSYTGWYWQHYTNWNFVSLLNCFWYQNNIIATWTLNNMSIFCELLLLYFFQHQKLRSYKMSALSRFEIIRFFWPNGLGYRQQQNFKKKGLLTTFS